MKIVIIGGGVMGNSLAYHLLADPTFDGEVVIVERDPSLSTSSSALSLAGIRQQYSQPINVRLSLESIKFLRQCEEILAIKDEKPFISLREKGYLLLAKDPQVELLRENQRLQQSCGADIIMMDRQALAERFPWLSLTDVAAASFGQTGEGWFDGYALLQGFARKARSLGAKHVRGEVYGIDMPNATAEAVVLSDGTRIACDCVVNAAGPWSGDLAALSAFYLPVRPRRRSVFLFACRKPIANCPVVFDPGGVSFRPEGDNFVCTAPPARDDDVDGLPLEPDYPLFDDVIWPILAERIHAFEEIKLIRGWAGYYEMNIVDQNGIIGPHSEVKNYFFLTGFSGHGIQQSPIAGRGLAELIIHGRYLTLDLASLSYHRLVDGALLKERNVFG